MDRPGLRRDSWGRLKVMSVVFILKKLQNGHFGATGLQGRAVRLEAAYALIGQGP